MKVSTFATITALAGGLAYVAGGNITETFTHSPGRSAASISQEAVAGLVPQLVNVIVPSSNGATRVVAFAKHEVTFGDWQKCVDAGGCSHTPRMRPNTRDDHPVSGVSWLDVHDYIVWISKVTGQNYRLPLESEWRAVAGDVLDKKVEKLFDDPRMAWAADYANFEKRAERATKPVGHYGEASNGIADLAGNVWEWTDTCWRSANSGATMEATENCGGVRVLAGAHMTYQSELIRVVPTGGCSIGFPPANIGFRLVADKPTERTASGQPG